MNILALDIATTTGFALGRAGAIPRSGSVRLKKPHEGPEIAAFNIRQFLREQIFSLFQPDLVCLEHYLNPVAQRSADAIILQIGCFFVATTEALTRSCRVVQPYPATIRKHFIGKARTGDRGETKRAVVNRAVVLGYIPKGCVDNDRADACALFDYAAAHYARVTPKSLVLFGEARV